MDKASGGGRIQQLRHISQMTNHPAKGGLSRFRLCRGSSWLVGGQSGFAGSDLERADKYLRTIAGWRIYESLIIPDDYSIFTYGIGIRIFNLQIVNLADEQRCSLYYVLDANDAF